MPGARFDVIYADGATWPVTAQRAAYLCRAARSRGCKPVFRYGQQNRRYIWIADSAAAIIPYRDDVRN